MQIIPINPSPRSDDYYLGEALAIKELDILNERIGEKRRTFMGYPCNGVFKLDQFFKWWSESFLSKTPLNEVGNPLSESGYALNARAFEARVLQFFADLYAVDPYWGYITSGGTQGNEQGLYMGRHALEKYGKPILYFSQEAHYSIASLGKVLGLDVCIIEATPHGEMNYDDLRLKLDPHRPALFSLSIGTTFKGGIDQLEMIEQIVHERGVEHVFYHADAALFGGYLPFYDCEGKPDLNFKRHSYDSIAVSGHKFFGSPVPLGVFLIRKDYLDNDEGEYIEYIHSRNITIPCSRSSLNTLILWWIIATKSKENFTDEVSQMLSNTTYFYQELQKRNYPVWLNPYSNIIFFRSPSPEICSYWTLSQQTCSKLGHLSHVVVMQHVDKAMIDQFLHDLDEGKSNSKIMKFRN
ncbi:MAG: histidine decarboxylase [Parachlamydiaceae bacterium]